MIQAGRQAQPYRRGPREPGMALRMMLAGKPGFQPNPQDLERATMQRQRGGLGALIQSLPRAGGQFGGGGLSVMRGGPHSGATGLSHPSDISRSIGVGQGDASRQSFFDRERALMDAAPYFDRLRQSRRSGDRFAALGR